MNKYGAKKTVVDGIKFDSRAEARRYVDLRLLQLAGKISGLTLQVPFELAPGVKFEGAARKTPALRYVADFVYKEGDEVVIEDTKGVITDGFRIKRHLMKTVLGYDVRLTK